MFHYPQVYFAVVVDIYNLSNNSWTTASLSQARGYLAATSVGNLALFAGGGNGNLYFSVVDIYNVASNTWTTANLFQACGDFAATTVWNLTIFAGGENGVSF